MRIKHTISPNWFVSLFTLLFLFGFMTTNASSNDPHPDCVLACPNDTIPPVITNCPSDTTLVFDESICGAVYSWDAITATDNCTTVPMVSSSYASGDTFRLETTTVLVTALDSAGLSSTCTFDVHLSNVTFQLTNCPGNVYKDADANCQATVTWSTSPSFLDNCGSNPHLDSTHVSGSKFDIDTTTVTYTLTNDLGNVSTCSFHVIVTDVTPPILTGCDLDTTIYPMGCFGIYLWDEDQIVVQDNCNAVKTPDPQFHSGSNFPMGTTTVTYTASDAHYTTQCSFDVTVIDTVAPFATYCPNDTTVILYTTCDSTIHWTDATFFDGCDTMPTVGVDAINGGSFAIGTHTITYTAEDDVHNIGYCQFDLTVKDNAPPVMTACPSDTIIYVGNNCTVTYNYNMPTATDVCSGTITPVATPSYTQFDIGIHNITITAEDPGGNQASCSFVVLARDTTFPTTICPQDIKINADGTTISDPDHIILGVAANGCDMPIINFKFPDITDNCVAMLVDSTVLVDTFPVGNSLYSYSFVDSSGNASACSFQVTVKPIQQSITIQASQNPVCPETDLTLSTSITDPTATYLWSGPFSFASNAPTPTIPGFNYANVGDYMVTVTLGGCILQPDSPLHISAAQGINANDDAFTIPINTTDSLAVTINDELFGQPVTVQIDQAPLNGASIAANSKIIYTPDAGYTGADQIFYSVCVTNCPTICATAQVNIEVNLSAGDTCIIPTLITPNDDNLNDEFILDCLGANSEQSKLIIFNQWGSRVYEAEPYLNDWKGTLSGNVEQPLPDGTYFYIFWKDKTQEPQKGFITLFR